MEVDDDERSKMDAEMEEEVDKTELLGLRDMTKGRTPKTMTFNGWTRAGLGLGSGEPDVPNLEERWEKEKKISIEDGQGGLSPEDDKEKNVLQGRGAMGTPLDKRTNSLPCATVVACLHLVKTEQCTSVHANITPIPLLSATHVSKYKLSSLCNCVWL